jgi:uncharacterized protein YdaT
VAQAMTKAKQWKKQRSMEEFDAFMLQKLNDIEDAEGKKARDAYNYNKQYQIDKAPTRHKRLWIWRGRTRIPF